MFISSSYVLPCRALRFHFSDVELTSWNFTEPSPPSRFSSCSRTALLHAPPLPCTLSLSKIKQDLPPGKSGTQVLSSPFPPCPHQEDAQALRPPTASQSHCLGWIRRVKRQPFPHGRANGRRGLSRQASLASSSLPWGEAREAFTPFSLPRHFKLDDPDDSPAIYFRHARRSSSFPPCLHRKIRAPAGAFLLMLMLITLLFV